MNNTFLGKFVFHFTNILLPLNNALDSPATFKAFMLQLGWNVDGTIPQSYGNVKTKISTLISKLKSLPSDASELDFIEILKDITEVYVAIKNLSNAPSPLTGGAAASFMNELPAHLFDYLIIKYLNLNFPTVYSVFNGLSIIENVYQTPTANRPNFNRQKLNFSKIFDIIKSPKDLITNSIDWDAGTYSFSKLSSILSNALSSLNITAVNYELPIAEEFRYNTAFSNSDNVTRGIEVDLATLLIGDDFKRVYIKIIESRNSTGDGIIIEFVIPPSISLEQGISPNLTLNIGASSALGGSPAFLVKSDSIKFKLLDSSATLNSIKFSLLYTPPTSVLIFGKSEGTRLQLLDTGISLECKPDGSNFEIITEADLSGLQFIINPGDSDGFIKKVFGDGEKKINLPIIISWSSKHGIRFKGSGAFEVALSPNIKIGPIVINELLLALKAIENQPLKTQIGATISGKIGPISFIVENIGIELKFDKNEGNAGPFGIDIGFKPPNGVGLKVKASKLEGGGYLYIDRDKGRYAGGIELDIFGKLRVTAVGIITTKNPDGTPGFSLLIAVGVEFSGIPVGFGFTFNGVGVLAGVNRTMNPNALRAGVKGGAINSLMFPKNVIENIKTLITDMESYFPIEQKKYTFGVFFLLKWGVGVPLVSIKLGVIISFPQPVRLAIVGIIQIALPDPNVPVLKLNVAFVGIIDFENKYISFDASIYDSRLLFITLYGDMAVRLFWGERREMLVSVGGFHPAYNAPAYLMLPKMDRMTLSIFDEKNLRLIIETYFAVTSNTVQFGVKLDFLLKVWKLKVLGWFGFDVLFQFNPFKFLSHVYAGLAVMWDDKELLCISLDFNLNGPGPWHAVGKGEFTVLGMKQSANFDETWGDEPDTSAPEIEVTPKLLDALNKDENWQGSLPEGRKTYVKLAVSGTGTLIMDPLGEFTITQKVLPFTINIERFGGQKVKDVGIYSLDLVKVNGVAITSPTSTKENFASAQFKEMNDNDKIKAPSFEFLPNGVKIGYDYSELMFGDFITKDIEYDVVLIDGENRTDINVLNTTIDINSFTKGGLISANQISKKTNRDIASPIDKVNFNQESYVLVSKDSLNTISTISIGSLGNAYTERDKIYTKSPELKGMYEIIPA